MELAPDVHLPDTLPPLTDGERSQIHESLKLENFEVFRDFIQQKHTAESSRIIAGSAPGESLAEVEGKIDASDQSTTDEAVNGYLGVYGFDEADPVRPTLVELLKKYSPLEVVPGDWELGPIDGDGNYDETQSGRALFAEEVTRLFGEVPEVDPGIIEVDPALKERMDQARDKYATEMARSRKSYIGRFFKTETQVGGILAKIPGVKATVRGWNKLKRSSGMQAISRGIDAGFERSAIAAKTEFIEVYNQMSEAVASELEARGCSAEMASQLSLLGNIAQDEKLEEAIVQKRQLKSKSTNWFVNKWVEQKGIKGGLKKAAVVVAAGAATGLTAGIFLGATAAFVAGATAGGYIGTHVSSRRANSLNNDIKTLAQVQSEEDIAKKEQLIRDRHEAGETGSVEDIVGITELRTNQELVGNRNRVKTSAAIGGLSGRAAIYGYDQLQNIFNNADSIKGSGHVVNGGPKHTLPEPPSHSPGHPHTPHPTPENPIRGLENFNVEPGNGITHELMDFAQANGHQITPEQANHLYENLLSRLGPNNIIDGGTYVRQAGDIGISSPGTTSWTPQAQEILTNLLTLR